MASRLKERLKAVRAWIALFLVGLAYRISPAGALPPRTSELCLPARNVIRFRVVRQIEGNKWNHYEGIDGGLARRMFEGVRDRGELGAMTLEMNEGKGWLVRGSYERQA